MFANRANENAINDSLSFLDQKSFLSNEDSNDNKGQFLELDKDGRFNKGKKHIKATLESDHLKSVLIEINDKDTISILKKKIGEKFESTFELYTGLTKVSASKIMKILKSNKESSQEEIVSHQVLDDDQMVTQVLHENEEVHFELFS